MSDLIETWKNDFRAFVNSLNLDRDDYKTMMEYIDEIPAVQPDHVADISKKVEGDCISRQAVVKFFNDWISCLDENCHHQSVADMIIIKNDFKNLPSAQPEPYWIPCSERMPEWWGTEVLTVTADGEYYVNYLMCEDKWFFEGAVAWMELPEPYRGGGKE